MKYPRPLLIAVCVTGIASCSAIFYAARNDRAFFQRLNALAPLTAPLLERENAGSNVSDSDGRGQGSTLHASLKALETQNALLQRQLASLRIQVDKSATAIERIGTTASRALEIAQIARENPNITDSTEWSDDVESRALNSLSPEDLEELTLTKMDFVEAKYLDEPVDGAWARETVTLIDQSLAVNELEKTSVISADCRATMCRIEVEHDDPNSQEEFQLWFQFYVAGALPSSTIYIEDLGSGMSKTTMFMSRQGHTLPDTRLSAW